jgi:myo-inositol 2-dehydrogenase / D-chiro-inositol 1-dehydrogenase
MRIGMIGYGGIAGAHVPGWLKRAKDHDVDLTVYDIAPERNAAARERGFATVVDSLEELLGRSDMVDICTPSDTHADLVQQVAAAGKDILCEKPLGMTPDEAIATARSCATAGVKLYVGHVVRFFGAYRTAHDDLVAGRLGIPSVQRFRRAGGLPRHNDWMVVEERSGGVVMDLMIHDIDQARWFAGDVVRAFGMSTRKGEAGDVDTQAFAVLTHASGAITHLTASWAMQSGFETSFEIAGTEGMAVYESDDRAAVRADRPELLDRAGLLPVMVGDSPFVEEIAELADAIEFGTPARVNVADAVAAVSIADAIRTSIRTGKAVEPVPVPEDLVEASSEGTRTAAGTWM